MTSNEARAETLVRALRAGIEHDREALQALFTDDVRAWTPALTTSSLSELIDALDRRDDSFSEMALDVIPLDVGGDYACVEWTVDMTHSGTISLGDQQERRAVRHSGHVARCHGRRVSRRPDLLAAPVLGRVHRARAARCPYRRTRPALGVDLTVTLELEWFRFHPRMGGADPPVEGTMSTEQELRVPS